MEPNLHKIKTGRWNSQHLSTIIKTKPKVFYVSTISSITVMVRDGTMLMA